MTRNGEAHLAVITGSVTRDKVRSGLKWFWQIGGVVWYAGTTLIQLGIRTRVVTRAASRDTELADALRSRGAELWLGSSAKTTVFVNEYAGDGLNDRKQRVMALADPIDGEVLSGALADADLVYLGPLHPADLGEEVTAVLQAQRPTLVALDVQGYTRTVSGGLVVEKLDQRLEALFDVCDIIKASAAEARLITGSSEPSSAAVQLARAGTGMEVVVTCGKDGAYIARQNQIHYELAQQIEVDDPTGAGDIFFASYLAQRIGGTSMDAAAEFAARFTAKRLTEPDRILQLSGGQQRLG